MSSESASKEDSSRRSAILIFIFWSFGITWACLFLALWLQKDLTVTLLIFTLHVSPPSILSLVGSLGPAAAAIIVLRGRSHRNEMKNLVRETFALRISPWNYILALGIPCLILGLAVIELLLISGIGFIQHPGALGMWVDL